MFCPDCGHTIHDGSKFCEFCGASLREERNMAPYEAVGNMMPAASMRSRGSSREPDPYKDQIADLRLEIKQLKLDLKHITTNMSNTRSQYYQTSAFVPHGMLRRGYKFLEDIRLLGPQQQKQQLQQQILRLEQELLGLQQAQRDWKDRR